MFPVRAVRATVSLVVAMNSPSTGPSARSVLARVSGGRANMVLAASTPIPAPTSWARIAPRVPGLHGELRGRHGQERDELNAADTAPGGCRSARPAQHRS